MYKRHLDKDKSKRSKYDPTIQESWSYFIQIQQILEAARVYDDELFSKLKEVLGIGEG